MLVQRLVERCRRGKKAQLVRAFGKDAVEEGVVETIRLGDRIAYALGFDDPAYFSRVFTRATGLSPRAFRQRLNDAAE